MSSAVTGHRWLVHRLDEQQTGSGDVILVVGVRCTRCGTRAEWRSAGLPPCTPGQQYTWERGWKPVSPDDA